MPTKKHTVRRNSRGLVHYSPRGDSLRSQDQAGFIPGQLHTSSSKLARSPPRKYKSKTAGASPRASSELVAKTMRANRSSGTQPELVLARLLRKQILRSSLPGSPDFVFARAKLAVFVHGCWWHRCPTCNIGLPKAHRTYWKRKFERNVERDKLNKKELRTAGWKVMEVWEHEVRHDPSRVALRIKASARANAAPRKV
jgi:DNA mismatch endonuclease, patch repair protein